MDLMTRKGRFMNEYEVIKANGYPLSYLVIAVRDEKDDSIELKVYSNEIHRHIKDLDEQYNEDLRPNNNPKEVIANYMFV